MFDVPEEHWESLDEYEGILTTWEEKICNLINNSIKGQRKAKVILPEIQKVLNKYPEVILKRDWNIGNCNLIKHKIYFEHDKPIKSSI